MKKALLLSSIVLMTWWLAFTTSMAQTGCTGQDPHNCNGCTKDSTYRFRVCIGPVTDTIDVTMCTQFATTQYISNPCTNCTRPLNSLTWVRKVCVPTSLSLVSVNSIYRAIMSATSLCCDSLFIPVSIPTCDTNTEACSTAYGVYCHVLALPKCVVRVGNCWQPCRQQCQDFCYIERRYCRSTAGKCSVCIEVPCSTPEPCPEGCIAFNCDLLLNPPGCCP